MELTSKEFFSFLLERWEHTHAQIKGKSDREREQTLREFYLQKLSSQNSMWVWFLTQVSDPASWQFRSSEMVVVTQVMGILTSMWFGEVFMAPYLTICPNSPIVGTWKGNQ